MVVASKPTVDRPVYVSGVNRNYNATLEYDHSKGQLVAPELKDATYTFYYNNTPL